MSSLEDEGVPDPDEQPPGVDADLAQEGLIAPGDAPRAAGRHGGTAAEQRAGTWPAQRSTEPGPERSLVARELRRETPEERRALRRERGDPALGQLAEDDREPGEFELVGDDSGIAPEERALSIIDEDDLEGDDLEEDDLVEDDLEGDDPGSQDRDPRTSGRDVGPAPRRAPRP